jgi:hypothetical protein
MSYGDGMPGYAVSFEDGTVLSLLAYNENQARLLAQRNFPEKTIDYVVPLDLDAFPY